MPRLVIHGLRLHPGHVASDRLITALKQMGVEMGSVVEVAPTSVRSVYGGHRDQPFLEIIGDTPGEVNKVADDPGVRKVCSEVGLEIEVGATLRRFIPLGKLNEPPEPFDERGPS